MNSKLLVAILCCLCSATATFAEPDPKELLQKMDQLYKSNSSKGKIEMEVVTPNWSRTMKMDIWSQGLDYTFITIKEPKKDKGVSSLKRKNEMWNFFPKINKVIKVPPSMMMGSWMGSDFTNDDLVRNYSLVDDYDFSVTSSNAEKIIISLKPKAKIVSLWGRIDLTINAKTELPETQEYYDEKGEKIRILNFKDVKTFGEKTIPATLELKSLTKKGHKTVVQYRQVEFDLDVPSSTFTLTNLQRRR